MHSHAERGNEWLLPSRHIDDDGRAEDRIGIFAVLVPVCEHRIARFLRRGATGHHEIHMLGEKLMGPLYDVTIRSTGKTMWGVVDKLEPIFPEYLWYFSRNKGIATTGGPMPDHSFERIVKGASFWVECQAGIKIILDSDNTAFFQ